MSTVLHSTSPQRLLYTLSDEAKDGIGRVSLLPTNATNFGEAPSFHWHTLMAVPFLHIFAHSLAVRS